jgi:hypothetical protein
MPQEDRQKNGGRKMKVARFAQQRGAGRLIFLPRIFLICSSRKAKLVFAWLLCSHHVRHKGLGQGLPR